MPDLNVAVIGAGIIGLTTALEIQKEFRGSQVSILADKFYQDTTSYVAAGIFRPSSSFEGPTEEITRKWINDAYHYWDDIRKTKDAPNAGITQMCGYIFSSRFPDITRNRYLENLVPIYRPATEFELKLCPGNWKYGSYFTTILTESARFLPWATEKFLNNGGKIITTQVKAFADLDKSYDVTINCTGLGAKYLCNDHKLVPMRGQILKVEAPWVKTFFYADFDTYIIPGFNGITLGGCRQYNSYETNVSKYDGLAIRERCEALLPSLRGAKTIAQYVGLRPHRTPVRVEKEIINVNGRKIKTVHNYGHGGYGVTTAPGTAIHAVKLLRETLSGNSKL